MPLSSKLLLIVVDGVPWRNWRRLFGNLEGWVASGDAQVWKMRAVLPSISGPCYASIHTGVPPQVHGVLANEIRFRIDLPDIFSQVARGGGKSGAVTHSYWSEFFQRHPFDLVRDMEYDEPQGPIHHGRFHTMTGYGHDNQMTPCDLDLFATLTMLCERHGIDYGLLHTCTLDSMGHRFGHDNTPMDHACAVMDSMLAAMLPRWRANGYEVIVTADHGQTDRGHHGGSEDLQQDFALYYFGPAKGPAPDTLLDQLQLAPTVLARLGAPIPDSMKAKPFLA
jgi:predicted AlkP superfamily pyrophosphatase or phosphodiesterase